MESTNILNFFQRQAYQRNANGGRTITQSNVPLNLNWVINDFFVRFLSPSRTGIYVRDDGAF